jgi:hypothetical protein
MRRMSSNIAANIVVGFDGGGGSRRRHYYLLTDDDVMYDKCAMSTIEIEDGVCLCSLSARQTKWSDGC